MNKISYLGSLIGLKKRWEERYIVLHRRTFPGVLDRIRKSNIRNYSIFLYKGILFSYLEYHGKDYNADMKAIADDTTRDWWKLTDPMQKPLEGRKKGEWWAAMKCVYENRTLKVNKEILYRKAFQLSSNKTDNSLKKLLGMLKEKKIKVPGNLSIYEWQHKYFFYYESADDVGFHLPKELTGKVKSMRMVFHTD
jgi:L-rhamnose mutarotase